MGWIVKDSSSLALHGLIQPSITDDAVRCASFDTSATGIDNLAIRMAALPGSGFPVNFNTPTNLGTRDMVGPFTIEGYVKWPSTPPAAQVFVFGIIGIVWNFGVDSAGHWTLTSPIITTAVSPVVGTRYHFAITRDGSNLVTLWINGTSLGTVTSAGTVFVQGMGLGSSGGNSSTSAYVSALRVTKNVCRYTTTFTPPGTTWPTTVGGDANWTNVTLLMRGDEQTVADADVQGDLNQTTPLAAFTSAPVTTQTFEENQTIFDYQDGGAYRVQGTTKVLGSPNVPISRRVDLQEARTRRVIRSVWSDPVTGAYTFDNIKYDPVAQAPKYNVETYDYLASYRAVIADNLTPEAMP